MLVGLAGAKRNGKDSVCNFLLEALTAENIPCCRRALADSLKEEVAWVLAGQFEYVDFSQKGTYYQEILSEMYKDETKENYRLLLQGWGTDFKRRVFGNSYWTSKLLSWYDSEENSNQIVIVPDIRFPNEIEMVKGKSGIVAKAVRPSIVSSDTHASETALDSYDLWDAVLIADDLDTLKKLTMEDLLPKVLQNWGRH